MLIAFNKPFGVISQFSSDGSPNRTLAEFGFPPGVYPVGRLDADSEGLLVLSNQPEWNARLLRPGEGHEREYWVQVEGIAMPEKLQCLSAGVVVQGRATLPCIAAVGLPTLRLVRVRIGKLWLKGLAPGDWKKVQGSEIG
jgi:23S rRNA pseudouridine2457 synthase